MIYISTKNCVDCGSQNVAERRRCRECAKFFNRRRAKDLYEKNGRYNYGESTCPICGKEMILWKKSQITHSSCRRKTVDNYNSVKRSNKANTIGRQKILDLGISIPIDYVVHHLDENPDNNNLINLVLMSRSAHNKLHRILQQSWSSALKNAEENLENCWDTLRDQITTAFLETESANVLKISDIGQSAAEPLS